MKYDSYLILKPLTVPKFCGAEVMYDRLLVNPSIELKPNLEFLYQQWLISQKILAEVHSFCSEFP